MEKRLMFELELIKPLLAGLVFLSLSLLFLSFVKGRKSRKDALVARKSDAEWARIAMSGEAPTSQLRSQKSEGGRGQSGGSLGVTTDGFDGDASGGSD